MPKFPTMPYLFDEEKSISTSSLKKWGYLKSNSIQSGIVTWSRNGIKTSSIGLTANIEQCKIFFNYSYNGEDINYSVKLISIPSNIGNGKIWYFLCPFTGKRCRKLHLINGYFKHRSALPEGMYSKQTQSKKWRQIEKVYGCYFDLEKHYAELYSKHFKKTYDGKLTKRYKKLIQKIENAERYSAIDIERLLLMK